MTEPVRPDDRELEQYLQGDSPLSRRYRAASRDTAPPELDDAVLAQARAELRRPRGPNRWLASAALAASVLLGVNLAWNLREVEPVPAVPVPAARAPAPDTAPPIPTAAEAPAAPREEDLAKRRQVDAERELEARQSAQAAKAEQRAPVAAAREQESERKMADAPERSAEPLRREALAGAAADGAPPQAPAAPALTESQKIDRLIAYVGNLQGAVFIRNADEHQAAEAARHLQMKREKAGKRVQTAGDFIRLCASHSYLTKEAYLIRFADGRTRTAEDVLREELARIEGGAPP